MTKNIKIFKIYNSNISIMKKITCLTYFCLCVSLAFLFSCRDDDGGALSSGENHTVSRVAFELPDYVQVSTRASESALKNVTVLQFIDGELAKQIDLEDEFFIQAVDLIGLDPMLAASLDENGALIRDGKENVIVFLANFKACFQTAAQTATLPAIGTRYATFMDYTHNLVTAQALSDLEYMPSTGFYYGGIVEDITNQINVKLNRLLARVNFTLNTDNFKYQGKRASVIINRIELRNVPSTITFFPQNRPALPVNNHSGEWPTKQTPYPNAIGGVDGYDATNFVTLGEDLNLTTGDVKAGFAALMPENARGSYAEITSNKEKHPATIAAGNQQTGWTYIYIDLDFSPSDGIVNNATYKIYLGGNDKGDINVLAGTQYNVTTYLYGANNSDTRITLSSVFDPTVIVNTNNYTILPLANSYLLNPEDPSLGNFLIPLAQARNGWRHIQNSINAAGDNSAGIDYVAQLDTLIQSGNWKMVTLWKTWSDATVVETSIKPTGITTTDGVATNNYYALLNGVSSIAKGNNCVLALQSTDDDTIWWTWHLWFTDYNPDLDETDANMKGQLHAYYGDAFSSSGLYVGKKMMDRNLGATIVDIANDAAIVQPTAEDNPKYYGLMYQWGRKDPFTPSSTGSISWYVTNAVPVYDATGASFPGINNDADGFPKIESLQGATVMNRLVDAVRHPMNFYHSGLNDDWTREDNTLWNAFVKTAFDPCPSGWRIPAGGTLAIYNTWAGFSATNSPSSVTNKGPFETGQPTVFQWRGADGTTNAVNNLGPRAGRLYDASVVGNGSDVTKAWFPSNGWRNARSGIFNNPGGVGMYWNAALPSGTIYKTYSLSFYDSFVQPSYSGNYRAAGAAIRCIQE